MDKREHPYTIDGNVNCNNYGKQYEDFSKKLKIELSYYPAIPLLDIYPKKTMTQIYTCTPVFSAALQTIA